MKSKPKRLSVKAEYLANIKFMGTEPEWPEGTILTKEAELKALNWYSNMMDAEDARTILVDWLRDDMNSMADQIEQLDAMWIPKSVAWIIRIGQRGGIFDRDMANIINAQLAIAVSHYKPKEPKPVKANVQDHINDKLNDLIGTIEVAIDKRDKKLDIKAFLKDQSSLIVRKVYDYYAPRHYEMVHTANDKDIVRPADFKEHKAYMMLLMADLLLIVGVEKPKAPRKKRKVNMAVKMRHFKPHVDSKVKPESVLGAQEVWLLNMKYNIVTALYADGPKGLDIHRTAIIGYDKNATVSKRCGRHVDNVVNVIQKGSKVARRKLINETLKTAPVDIKNRVNEEVVILFSSK